MQPPNQVPANPAEAYERFLVPALFAPWAEALLDRAAPEPGERVLDVACGTGIVARRAATRVGPTGRVVGIDPNPGMLAVAQATAAEGAAIEWREGRAEDLPVADAAFDVVCCQQGLQFFADRAAGLREMRRALAAGGRVAVAVGQGIAHQPVHAALDEVAVRHLGAPIFSRTIFALGDAQELRALLEGAEFHDVVIESLSAVARVPDPAAFVRIQLFAAAMATPSLAGMDQTERAAAFEAIQADAGAALRPFVEDGALVVPAHAHLALARP